MAKDFTIDLRSIERLAWQLREDAGRGATEALDQIKDDWVRESRDIAPLDSGNLRRQINGELEGQALESSVVVTANATQAKGGRRFNYAYYIHEENAGGKNLRTPGTVKKFLDEAVDEEKYQKWLEDDIADELKKAGW